MTIQEAFEDFILSRKLADLSAKSISSYQQFVSKFVLAVGANKPLESLSQKDLNDYISSLIDRPLSKATRSTYIRHIKIFLKWVQENYDVCYEYKRVKVPKMPKKNVKIYSDEELLEIFSHVHAESDWLVLRNKCIIALMYDSGLRQSEVCTLERSCVSFSTNRMTVHGKGCKDRTVPLGAFTKRFLQEYLDLCPYSSKFVFVTRRGEPLTNNAVKLLVNKLAHELPFELSSHKLRHNYATNYCLDQYEAKGQIDIYRLMVLMGHEDIETTKRYLHHANETICAKENISHLDKVYKTEN